MQTHVKAFYPDIKYVHGRPYHPQSQGNLEGIKIDQRLQSKKSIRKSRKLQRPHQKGVAKTNSGSATTDG